MDVKTSMAALQVTGAQIAQPGAMERGSPASAAKEFEAMFLTEMVNEMLSEVDLGDFGGGKAEEQWRYFLAEAFGKEIAEQGGAGIARNLEQAMSAYDAASRRGANT